MRKNELGEWIKCNILEIITLILVLILVINAFPKNTTQIEKKEIQKEQLTEEKAGEQIEQPIGVAAEEVSKEAEQALNETSEEIKGEGTVEPTE